MTTWPPHVGVPRTPPEDLPFCHADGADPVGYESCWDCVNCAAKPTCYVRSKADGLAAADVVDVEVEALLRGSTTYAVVAERQRLRAPFTERTVPPHLRPEALATRAPEAFLTAPAPPPEPPQIDAGPKPYRPAPIFAGDAPWGRLASGDPCPTPKQVTEAQMATLLRVATAALKFPFPLRVGQELRRIKRHGPQRHSMVRVELRKRGFWAEGYYYASLSSAVMAVEKRQVSGFNYFRADRRNVVVIDVDGTLLWQHGAVVDAWQ